MIFFILISHKAKKMEDVLLYIRQMFQLHKLSFLCKKYYYYRYPIHIKVKSFYKSILDEFKKSDLLKKNLEKLDIPISPQNKYYLLLVLKSNYLDINLDEFENLKSLSCYIGYPLRLIGINTNSIKVLKIRKVEPKILTKMNLRKLTLYEHEEGINLTSMTNLEKFFIYNNFDINYTLCDHFDNLKVLSLDENIFIAENILRKLDLYELYCSKNKYITNLNYMTNLKVLHSHHVLQEGIKDLKNLRIFQCLTNPNITDLNHMTNLETLWSNFIKQEGIKDLVNLKELNCWINGNITDLNHMTNLKILYSQRIEQEGINKLTSLKYFHCKFNENIIDLNHMINLDVLISDHILQEGIENLNLSIFDCKDNQHITDLNHMTKLDMLVSNHILQEGIENLNLSIFDCKDNQHITDLNHMINLKYLRSNFIKQKGIENLTGLIIFDCKNNNNDFDVSHMKKLQVFNVT